MTKREKRERKQIRLYKLKKIIKNLTQALVSSVAAGMLFIGIFGDSEILNVLQLWTYKIALIAAGILLMFIGYVIYKINIKKPFITKQHDKPMDSKAFNDLILKFEVIEPPNEKNTSYEVSRQVLINCVNSVNE